MGKRFISFDDQRNSLEMTISGEKFVINRLTIEAGDLVKQYKAAQFMSLSHAELFKTDINAVDETRDRSELIEEIRGKVDSYIVAAKEEEQRVNALQQDVIKKILEDNNLKYDRKLWTRTVDAGIADKFIDAVLDKDTPDEGVKKGGPVPQTPGE